MLARRCLRVWAVCVLCGGTALLRAEDKDKARLFNTFYAEGEHITYVLVLHGGTQKTFELYGPDNEKVSGTVRASDAHVTLVSGNVQRKFHYDLKGSDLKLGPREDDEPVKGNLLGEMPPTQSAILRTWYISQENWKKKRRPLFVFPKDRAAVRAQADADPAVPASSPAAPAGPSGQAVGNFKDITGMYVIAGADGSAAHTLAINPSGRFLYTRQDGVEQRGLLMRTDTDLSFIGASLQRHFTLRVLARGALELRRRPSDVVVVQDVLGAMPPAGHAAVVWTNRDRAGKPAVAAGPSVPAAAPVPELPPQPAARPETPPVASQPPPAAPGTPAAPSSPAPALTIKDLAGTYTCKSNAFLTETIKLSADGSFAYSDSNGAEASGKLKLDGLTLTLTAQAVVREFSVRRTDGALTLTSTAADAPKVDNDLASMSPAGGKSAAYIKKAP